MADYLVAIPTYWTHPEGGGPETVVYDHPTPLDEAGTLRRTLESLAGHRGLGLRVAVVAAAAHPSLAPAVEERLNGLLNDPPLPYPVLLCAASHQQALKGFLTAHGRQDDGDLVDAAGYAQVRNLTLVLAALWQAEALVSLDDDEVVADPEFFDKITEDLLILGREHEVFGLAGFYQNADGGVLLPEPREAWARFWPKFPWMNQAFQELILTGPRLKPTPLAFGGNFVVPANLLRRLPFDPAITRGEDVDYVLNARFFGIPFFLDNTLAIVHLPPAKPHPTWQRLRQDLVRFAYTRRKLAGQIDRPGLTRVAARDLAPYPGNFLAADLDLCAYQAHTRLALDYLAAGDGDAARRTLENLTVLEEINQAPGNPFQDYLDLQQRWQRFMAWLADPQVAAAARRAVWGAP